MIEILNVAAGRKCPLTGRIEKNRNHIRGFTPVIERALNQIDHVETKAVECCLGVKGDVTDMAAIARF